MNMTKILNNIVSCEGVLIKTSEISDLVEKSNGDVRSAINNLQFYDKKSSRTPKKHPKKLKSLENTNVKPFDEQIGPLDLFHALGKVLYAKRNPDGSYESKPDVSLYMYANILVTHCFFIAYHQQITNGKRSIHYLFTSELFGILSRYRILC
jgi:replication-associated recombination protein RarA